MGTDKKKWHQDDPFTFSSQRSKVFKERHFSCEDCDGTVSGGFDAASSQVRRRSLSKDKAGFWGLERILTAPPEWDLFVCRSSCVRTTSTSSPIWHEWSHMSSFIPLTTAGPTWTGSTTSDIWLVLRWAPMCSVLVAFMCNGNFDYCVILVSSWTLCFCCLSLHVE